MTNGLEYVPAQEELFYDAICKLQHMYGREPKGGGFFLFFLSTVGNYSLGRHRILVSLEVKLVCLGDEWVLCSLGILKKIRSIS